MTIQSTLPGAPISFHADLTTSNATAIWTGDQNGALLTALQITNDSVSASSLSVSIFDGTSDKPLFDKEGVAADATLQLELPGAIYIAQDHEVRVRAEHADRLHVWAFLIRR